jgi:hypothetical protein
LGMDVIPFSATVVVAAHPVDSESKMIGWLLLLFIELNLRECFRESQGVLWVRVANDLPEFGSWISLLTPFDCHLWSDWCCFFHCDLLRLRLMFWFSSLSSLLFWFS